MISALFHDIGKCNTTKKGDDGEYHSNNHAVVGERITRRILWNIDINSREFIASMVSNHMKPLYYIDKEDSNKYLRETLENCKYDVMALFLLKISDCMGAINDDTEYGEKLHKFMEDGASMILTPFNSDEAKFNYFNRGYSYEECVTYPCEHFDKPYDIANQLIMGENFKFPIKLEEYSNNENSTCKFNITIMCGLPGSGKSTYIASDPILNKLPIVCRDNIRKDIGLCGEKPFGNKNEEKKVTEIEHNKILEYCENNQSFVIDATNIRKFYRSGIIKMVSSYNPYIHIIYVEAPTIQDNINRRDGTINKDVILKMQAEMDFPRNTECHKLTIIKQKNN